MPSCAAEAVLAVGNALGVVETVAKGSRGHVALTGTVGGAGLSDAPQNMARARPWRPRPWRIGFA